MNTVGWVIGIVCGFLFFAGSAIWLLLRHARVRMQRLEQTDARLRDGEEQFRTLFTSAADAIAVHDLETGRFLEVNEEGLRRWGYSLEEMLGMTPADLDIPEHANEVPGRLRELSEKGRIFFETVHRCKDGRLIDTEVSAQLIQRAGRPAVLVIGRDITERKRVEVAACESEERFRVAFHTSPDAINIIRLVDGVFVDINEGFTAQTGYTREDVVGKRSLDIDIWCDPADQQKLVEGLQKKGSYENLETRLRRKNGDIGIGLMSAKIIMLQGVPHILSITRDITARKQAEDALRESDARYRSLFGNSHAVMLVIDPDGGAIVDANPGAAKYYGWTQEELRQKKISEIDTLSPDEVQAEMDLARREQRNQFFFRHRLADGSIRDVEVFSGPIIVQDRSLLYSIIHDVTERKRAEEAVRDGEERFRVAFQTSPDAININRLADGVFVDINAGFTALTGYIREDVIGRRSLDIEIWCDPVDRQKLVEGLQEKGYYENLEARFRRKNGDIGIGLMSAKIIMLQGVPHILSITRDITERKRAEESLRESEERLRLALAATEQLLAQIQAQARQVQQIIGTVPEGVLLLDASGRVLLTNPVAENILSSLAIDVGERLTHLGNRTLAELLTSPPQGLRHEVTAGERQLEIIARPIANGSEPEHWVLVIHDATQERSVRQQLERQERLASVGQLAAGIAHDFNNILAGIVLYSQMSLRMPDLPSKMHERLTIIVEQAHRAADLINQILDFGRRAVLDRQPVNLATLLKEQVELWERTLPETIRITLTYGADAYIVNADQTRMQQMFMNLVLNARDAMPEGGVLSIAMVRVYLADAEPAGEWVRVEVMDTGTGIPEKILSRIYDPFFTTKEPGKGSGLGLAQVYGIVVSHDGWIDVKTQVGVGTTFSIYLPALRIPGAAVSVSQPGALSVGHGETILVVEDNPVTRAAIVSALEMLQYHALEATNGKEALAIFAQHRAEIALVLSDLVMPEMGGKALAVALRQHAPLVRVVVMSGHPLGVEVDSLRESGVVAWVQKPPDLQELAEALSQALDS